MKKNIDSEIGKRVRSCREKLGYSREELSEKANIATSFLSTIELGKGSFTAEVLKKLCKALGVSADYIVFGKEHDECWDSISDMLSGLDKRYFSYVENIVSSYIKSILINEE